MEDRSGGVRAYASNIFSVVSEHCSILIYRQRVRAYGIKVPEVFIECRTST